MPADPRITLLGPQRNPRLEPVLRGLGLRGKRFATITAGWRDREAEDGLLNEVLGGHTHNLRLWELMQRLWEADPELAAADRERRRVMHEMQDLYVIGLQQAIEGIHRIAGHTPRYEEIRQMAINDILQILRDLDTRHARRVNELHLEFYERYQPHHRDTVLQARAHVGEQIADSDAVVITGGHVGVLLGAMHIFNLTPALGYAHTEEHADGTTTVTPRVYRPVLAWGAGAMALTEKVYLFHDFAVVSPGVSELLMDGVGLTRGVVALPSAAERLDLKNRTSMRSLATRCAPCVLLPLDEGARVTLTRDGELPAGVRVVGTDGRTRRHTVEQAEPAAGPGEETR